METSNTSGPTVVARANVLHIASGTFPSSALSMIGLGIDKATTTTTSVSTTTNAGHPHSHVSSHTHSRCVKKEYPHEDLPLRLSSVTKCSSVSSLPTREAASLVPSSGCCSFDEEPVQVAQQFSDVTFYQDFVAGGIAGSASVIVGHPFDTIKVRVQASANCGGILSSLSSEFGGVSSLFRGMGTPLCSAAVVNAVIFSSYGSASKVYDHYSCGTDFTKANSASARDPWQKSTICGAFAGLVQCTIICPMEHIKCRLQVQHGKGAVDAVYSGPLQAMQSIIKNHGFSRLYQGWWSSLWREVPAFALYFASYDMIKEHVNDIIFNKMLSERKYASFGGELDDRRTMEQRQVPPTGTMHTQAWLASAIAGGFAGAITWAIVYPVDVIKTRIQTAPLDTPRAQLTIWKVGQTIVRQHGWRYLFRGLGVALVRAFPVNATLFPIYEFTLLQMQMTSSLTSSSAPNLNYSYSQ